MSSTKKTKKVEKNEKKGYTKVTKRLVQIERNTSPVTFNRKQTLIVASTFVIIALLLVIYFKKQEELTYFDSILKVLNQPIMYSLVLPIALVISFQEIKWRERK